MMSAGSPAGGASGGAPGTSEGLGAAASNGSGTSNLLTDFETAYEEAIGTLTKEDNVFDKSPETLNQELETKILKMSEMARKIETFFCQKRFLLHAHKPEYLLREEIQEMKTEINRKNELIRRHGEKITHWQALLQGEVQGVGGGGGAAAAVPTTSAGPDQPQIQQQQPPHHNTTVVRPGAPLQPGVGAPQGGFMPGNNYRMINPNRGGMPPHPHAPIGAGSPLAYLEKTASSIGVNQSPYGPR